MKLKDVKGQIDNYFNNLTPAMAINNFENMGVQLVDIPEIELALDNQLSGLGFKQNLAYVKPTWIKNAAGNTFYRIVLLKSNKLNIKIINEVQTGTRSYREHIIENKTIDYDPDTLVEQLVILYDELQQ